MPSPALPKVTMPFTFAGLTVTTVAEDPALAEQIEAIVRRVWPAVILEGHGLFADMPHDWWGVYSRWPQLQFAVSASGSSTLLAGANALAMAWHGPLNALPARGWAWAMHSAAAAQEVGEAPVTQCALGVSILPEAQGRGLSATMLQIMKELGKRAGLARLVAPVRPSWKARYPLTTIDDYVMWRHSDGLSFDPWLRSHERIGGRRLAVCHESMGIQGTVAEWERWSGLRFPVSGAYAVDHCLAPVQISLEDDRGRYIEPNVWVMHEYAAAPEATPPEEPAQ